MGMMGMGGKDATPIEKLRQVSLGITVMVLIQFGIGMGVMAAGKISHQGNGVFPAFGHALTSTPVVLAIHAWVGLILVGGTIHTLMTAMTVKRPALMVTTVLGALFLIGAAFSGAAFVNKGDDAASVSMAVLSVAAIGCYLANVVMTNAAARQSNVAGNEV